jgi:CubicO group peptidase (beta-lactamase class C family)
MKPIILILATLLLLHTVEISQAQVSSKVVAGMSLDRLKHYEDYVKREISSGRIPGAVTLIVRKGETVYSSAIGISNPANKSEMKTDNIFYIQSMTKPIITTAFMMLFEEGHFLLTDPLSKYLPAAKNLQVLKNQQEGKGGVTEPLKREIILADLLSHTAGFSHGLGETKYEKEILEVLSKPHKTIQERVDEFLSIPLLGQPGEQWAYSITPDILSVLIEKFSGQSTNQFLTERIFKPLGMRTSSAELLKYRDRIQVGF